MNQPINENNHWNEFWNRRMQSATWNVQTPDDHLVSFLKSYTPKTVLELGCGTGVNARYISNYANIDAIDISTFAVGEAKKIPGIVNYILGDFISYPFKKKYDFVFDRGFYHGYLGCNLSDRKPIAKKISELLLPDGFWLSIIGSNEGVTGENIGPPQHSLNDVVDSINEYFKIVSIQLSKINNQNRPPSPAWMVVATLRD